MMNTKKHLPAQNRIQHLAIGSAIPPYFFRFFLLCIVFLTTILPNLAIAQSLVSGTPPGANPFAVTVLENSTGTTFPAQTSGIVYTVSVTTPPTKGTVAVSGFDFTYTPNPNTSGTDSFYYVANNLDGISAPARVSITINPIVPTPNNVVVTVFENSLNNIILPNITGIASSVSIVNDPSNGVANSSGLSMTYTPTAGYLGSDSFTYSASNISGTSSALGTVSISVVGAPPVAKQTRLEVQQNSRDNSVSANISGTANSISLLSQPTYGTATISGLNVIYTPMLNYVGPDSLMYAATNSHGTSSPARILINVNEIAPIANAINATVLQDSTANVIKSNTLGTPSSIAISIMPAHGTATVSGLNIVYTPNSGYVGYDAFKYTATNASGTSVAADVAITIQGTVAVANPISSTVLQDSNQNKIISSIVGNASSIAIQSQPSHGSVSVSGFNMLYTPAPGFTGIDNFSYTAVNAYGSSVSATVTVTVVGAAPSANPLSLNVLQNSANNVIASNITGTANSISISSAASHGNVQINGLNMIYTPATGYTGIDRFSYIASNATGNSTAAEVTVTVVGVVPIANNITTTILQDSSNNIIASNITGTAVSISINSAPAHGTASVNGLNVMYTPSAGYVGADQFSYVATNATGTSAPATVSITVTGVAPSANAVTANVLQNSSNNLISSKITGTASSINVVTPPSNGSVSVSGLNLIYTPTPGFTGVDSFSYRASNNSGNSNPASVTVNVTGVVPSTNNVNASVLQNSSNNTIATSVSGTVNNIVISGAPAHGIATVSGNNILYTPTTGFVGNDKITYFASNATGNSLPADINVTVNGIAPVANPVSGNVSAGSSSNTINSNVSGNVASIALASTPIHGTASVSGLNIIYTPSAAYTGTDTFTYIATNAYGSSAPATVSITVNDTAPIANAINVTVLMNSSNNLISTDTSGTVNSISLGRMPSFGTATVSGTKIIYQPSVGYVGTDSFTYLANNAAGSSVPATITVTVKEIIPVANAISVNVAMNSNANAINPNIVGSASGISIVGAASHGIASANGLQISYTPNPNYVGTDTFTYRAINASGTSDIATVTVQVVGTAPTAATIQASVLANSSNNAIAAQTSGTVTSISIQSQPQHGSAQVNGLNILYTPSSAYVGNDVLTYLASNGAGNSAPATINITVLPIAPSASPINVNVLSDSSNNPIAPVTSGTVTAISIGSAPNKGSVSINGNMLSYTPNAGFVGQDNFSYIASNGSASASPAIVTVTVTAATPVANPLNASVLMNSSNNVLTPTIDGTSTSISLKTAATRGVAVIEGQKIIYTPNANYIGVDSFSYVANNLTSSSAPATVTVTINGVAPIARAISATVLVNSSNNPIETAITGNASSITLGSNPSHGSVSIAGLVISYTPSANFIGADSFTYIATNASGNSEPANVSIIVNEAVAIANPVNAVVLSNSNANSISASTSGNVNNLVIQNPPQHGTASISGNNFIYTPIKDFVGIDSFTYIAVNTAGNSLPAAVNLTIKATPPSANPVSTSVTSNTGATVIRPLINGTVERIAIAQAAQHGTATVNGFEIQYIPASNFVGTDTFSFVAINAAGTSEPVTVTVIVKAAPIELKGANLSVIAGSSTSIDLNTLVIGNATTNATFSLSKAPLHGVATITGKQLNFTAHNDFSGNDSLMLIANSNGINSQPVAITIVISKRADPTQNRAVQAIQATKESVIRQFERLQLENFNGRLTEISSQNSALKSKEDKKKNEDTCSKVSLWASGVNSFSTISADYEIKNRNGGASFGGDRCIGSPDTILGFGVGYANQSGELRGMNASMSANARNVANYGQISPFPLFHFSWVLGINDINSEYTRTIDGFNSGSGMAAPPSFGLAAAPPGSTQHTGKWSGKQKIGSTSLGFDINFTDFKISPYLRLDRSTISIAPYAETGDARTALRYQEQSFNSQRTTFGMNTETVVKSRFGELTPRLRVEYQRDVGKRNDIKINYLDNLDGVPYIINGSNLDRKLFHMGIGGDLLLDSGWVIILNYGYYRSNEGNSSNALRLRLSYRL